MTLDAAESAIGRSQLFEVDATTGRHRLVADVGEQNLRFVMDTAGVPRFAYGMDKNEQQLLYVADAAGEQWRQVPAGSVGGVFTPTGFSADGQDVSGLHPAHNGPPGLRSAGGRAG